MANVKFLTGTETNLLKTNSDGSYVNPIVEGSLYVTAEKVSGVWVSNLYYDVNGQRIKVADTSGKAMYDHLNNNIAQTYIKKITMEGSTYASTDGATLTYTKGDNSEVTILLPLASATKAGTVNTGAQTFAGNKTFMGQVILQGGTDTAAGTANSGALIIGSPTGAHISVDANEIQAKASGTASAQLYINNDGGITQFGGIVQPKTDNTFTLGTEKLRWKTIEAVTVNATTFNGALNGNVTGNLNGNAATADKWYTARTITLGSDLQGSVSIDGSQNVTLNAQHYNVSCSSNNTSNYPWHRIATTGVVTGTHVDKDMTIVIRHNYSGGGYGVAKVSLRTNASGSNSSASVTWLYRYNIGKEDLQIGLRNTSGNTLADLYYKVSTWARAVIYQVEGARSWTLIASSEASDTTSTDKKTSKEVYTSVSNGNTLLAANYTSTIKASDGATVQNANYASTADGAKTDSANNTITTHYLSNIDFDGTTNKATKVVVNLYDGSGAIKATVDFPTASASRAGAITTGTQTLTGAKTLDANGSLTIQKNSGFNYSGIGTASDAVARHVWFSHSSNKGMPILSDKFKYNPASTDAWATVVANATDKTGAAYGKLIVDVLEGIAARAYADDRGQQISKKYVASLSFDGTTNKATKVTMTYNDGTGAEIATVDFPSASATAAGAITTGTQTLTGAKTLDANGSLTIQKASGFNYSGIESATSNQARHVWFSHASNVGTPVKNDKFKLNPGATDTWATVVANATDKTGSAYSKLIVDVVEGIAARAYADDRGQKISTKYVASMAFSGTGSAVTLTYRDGAGADIGTTNIPNASTSAAGVITNAAQSIGGDKTFYGMIKFPNVTEGTTKGVYWTMAANDYAQIIAGGTASDSGYLEINTGDNGNEPIYVRQYSAGTLKRTLTLLNGSGNTIVPGNILPVTHASADTTGQTIGSSSALWKEIYGRIFYAYSKYTTPSGLFYANNDGDMYVANNTGLGVAPDTTYTLKVTGNTLNNGIVYFANGTTNYINNSADARLNTLGINGANTTYRLYVNGNTLNNGIVYFANGTTYYINNSADSRLRYVGVGNLAPSSSYALRIGGNVYLNGIHYFANGTTYYVNNSGVAHFKQVLVNGGNTAYDFSVSGTGYFASDVTVDGSVTIGGDTNFKGNLIIADGKQIKRNGKSVSWKLGRDSAILRELTAPGYHVIWSSKTTNGTWDIGEYNADGFYDHLLFSYVTDTRYSSGDNGTDAQFRFRNNGIFQAPYISINGANGSYRLYVNGTSYFNGNATHNGIVYFANGTKYFINNSAHGHLSTLAINGDSSDSYSSKGYQLYIGGTTLHKSTVYFANGTNYYINASADTRLRYTVIGGTSLSPSSTYPLQVIGHAAITGDIKMRTGNTAIHWDDGTYQQRIITTDDSTANTNVFRFQQSSDTASSWGDLLAIRDNAVVVLTANTGRLSKYYSSASTIPAISISSNNLNINAIRIAHSTDGDNFSTGYTVKYLGASDGVNNRLELWCDGNGAANNAGTEQIGISVNQGGYVGIGVAAQIAYRLYVNGPSYLNGITNIVNGEEATSATTGTLRVTGGISVSANSWFGANITSDGYINAAKGFGVTQSDGIGKGISLYGTYAGTTPTYGIMFAKTATFGTLGGVTSDWATYFTMSNTDARGWIFRRNTTGTTAGTHNVFSIDTFGNLYSYWNAAVGIWHKVKNSLREMGIYSAASGNAGLYDFTRGVWLIYTRQSDAQTELYNNTYTKHLYPAAGNTYDIGASGTAYHYRAMYSRRYNVYDSNGSQVWTSYIQTTGTTSAVGNADTVLGNSIASGTAGNSRGRLVIYGTGAYYSLFQTNAASSHKTVTIPNYAGYMVIGNNGVTNPTSRTGYKIPFYLNDYQRLGCNNGIMYYTLEGTADALGYADLQLGNSTASGTAANKQGRIFMFGSGAYYTTIVSEVASSNKTVTIPNYAGYNLIAQNAYTNPTSATSYFIPFYNVVHQRTSANNGLIYRTLEGTTSAVGYGGLYLGNSTASGTAANKYGFIRLYSQSSGYVQIQTGTQDTSNYTLYLPGATGQLVYHTNDTAIGGSTTPVYINAAGQAVACTSYTSALDDRYVNVTGDTMTGILYAPALWANKSTGENQNGVGYSGGNLYFWGNASSGTAGIYDSNFGYLLQRNTSSNGYNLFATHGAFGGYNNTSYALSTSSFICNSWIRTTGSTGWYNESYGGGIYMTDTTWVRTYNNKSFYCSQTIGAGVRIYVGYDSGVTGSVSCSNWFRSNGATGWYNATYGGGWYQTDTTYIRTHGTFQVYSPGRYLSGDVPSSWLDGQKRASYYINSCSDTGSYHPWMAQTNTGSAKYFSFGILGTSFYWIGSTTSRTTNGYDYGMSFNIANGYLQGCSRVYNAVWNDYAEFRKANTVEPGRVVIETKFGEMKKSTARLQPGGSIISDTYGNAMGETEECKTPIAVAGRVLAYPYEDIEIYEAGDAVCTGPNGTVSKMTREEIREYPERIVGIVSEIPTYETWGQENVSVNGRIWIKVK